MKNHTIRHILVRLALLLGATGISLLLCIVLLKTYLHSRFPHPTDMKGKGFVLSATTDNLKYFYEPSPNSVEIWNPDWLREKVENHINADTLNEPKDYPSDKAPDTYRILTLGDSYTYGHFVPVWENYSKVLEASLNTNLSCPTYHSFEVINLGIPGYDIAYSTHRFASRGLKYHPDLVIWLLNYWNMLTINEERIPLQNKLISMGIPLFNERTKENEAVILALQQIKAKLGDTGVRAYQQKALENFTTIYQGNLLLLSFTHMPSADMNVLTTFIHSNANYSFFPDFLDYDGHPEYQLPDHHPNAGGHQAIAGKIEDYLLHHQLSECAKRL